MDENNLNMLPNSIGKLKKLIQKEMSIPVKPYGLGSNHAMYLLQLYIYRDGLTLKKLSDNLGVDKANTTRVIADLDAKGYTVNDVADNNVRKYNVFLTDEGRVVAKEVYDFVTDMRAKMVSTITVDELECFFLTYKKLVDAFLEYDDNNS